MRGPALAGLLLLLLAGCASSGAVQAPRSALEARAAQTRTFEADDRRLVLTALVQGLQDGGFQIAQVDSDGGFVSANSESVAGKDAPGAVKAMLWPYALMFPGLFGNRRHTVVEVTGTVVDEGAVKRVRLQCRTKVLDSAGVLKKLNEIDDPKLYQGLFNRIDKALFLAREKL